MKMNKKFALFFVSVAVILASFAVPASCDNILTGWMKNFEEKSKGKIAEEVKSFILNKLGLVGSLGDLATSGLFSGSDKADNETLSNVKEIIQAAKDGDEESQYKLGRMYEEGTSKGITKDYYDAARWYTKSASTGYAKAIYRLGLLYNKGQGVIQNKARGLSLITQAAQQGYVSAQLL